MLRCLFVLLASLSSLTAAAEPIPLTWGPHKDLTAKPAPGGAIEITLQSGHPHFWTGIVPPAFDPDQHRIFELDYFAPSGIQKATLRFRIADGSMVVAGSQPMPLSETWQPWTFDLSTIKTRPAAGHPEMRFHLALEGKPGTVLQVRGFRLRESNPEERRLQDQRESLLRSREADAAAILASLDTAWPATLETVHIDRGEITLTGRTPAKDARLHSLPPELPSHAAQPDAVTSHPLETDAEGRFRLVLPRIDPATQRDRALHRWRLSSAGSWISAARWPTTTGAALGGSLPRLSAPHPKGLGGIPHLAGDDHEIFDLGIHHATVNIVLNALIRDTPAPGFAPWPCDGITYHVNEAALRAKDATLSRLSRKNIIVSAILLIGNHRHPNGTPHSLLTHPEAQARGIYAMPNLTSEPATRLYAAAIRLLAERYDGSAPDRGRISNWILHNEIDQAGTWTNMGDQPLPRYLDTYLRSARIVHHTARLFDRHARVFVSLTHHWTQQSHGTGTYVVRDLIDLFARMARAEGDFEWGLAYHPYPRDLRNPDTWNDADLTTTFDTKYITPKNLEVLPAYLQQESLLFEGKARGILLSEQGFNSPTLSETDQRRQAAGLVYVFRKLKSLPGIEAYHLHRYQDMPEGEGGLRLGLITETGARKLAWDAYRAIGTNSPEEKTFEALADEVISSTTKSP